MNLEELKRYFYMQDGVLYRSLAVGGQPIDAIAGWVTECNGRPYWKVMFKRRTVYVHHVIYVLTHGELPKVVDHINGDSLDNRIENLRAATQAQNIANSRLSRANSSGIKGVTWRSDTKKWAAQITVGGKHISLGSHTELDDAAAAYAAGSKKYFGEFARTQEASNRGQDRAAR